jgi:hypothetical protein
MKLLANWRDVLSRAWSVRLIILAAILSGAEVTLSMLDGVLNIPAGIFAALTGLVGAAALFARFGAAGGPVR